MKKSLIIFFALAFLFFPLISSAEITLLNTDTNLSQGETLIAKVSGNFVDAIANENIFFYKGQILDQNFRVSMEHNITKIGDDYYIYALTSGKTQDNYSISIENVRYMKGAETVSDKIIKNFTITNDMAAFSLKPGFVIASGDFFVEVQNLEENEIAINVDTMINNSGVRKIFVSGSTSTTNSISLKSGEIKKINFQLSSGSPALQNVELSSENFTYNLPVYLSTSSGVTVNEASFRIEPSELTLSLDANSTIKRTIRIYNTGDKDLKDISLSLPSSLTSYVLLSQTKVDVNAKSNVPVELSFSSKKITEVDGTLKATVGNLTASLEISLAFSKPVVQTNQTIPAVKTCAEINGTLYDTQTQNCGLTPIDAKDGWCCQGIVSPIPEDSTGKIIAVVIIVIIILGLIWFYFAKFRKAKKPVDLLKVANQKKPGFFSKK
jgi:hypothetical protein